MSSQTVSPTLMSPMSRIGAAGAGLEVAVLVEDAVVRQVDLAVERLHLALGEHGRGVVDVLGALGEPDDRHEAVRLLGQLVQRRSRVGQETLLEQQVLGRVAGERELGEEDELRARLGRPAHALAHLVRVARDVAHRRVHLVQRDADGSGVCHPSSIALGCREPRRRLSRGRAAAQPELHELAQPRVVRGGRLQRVPPRQRGDRRAAGLIPCQEDRLPGLRDGRVECARDVVLQAPQGRPQGSGRGTRARRRRPPAP